MAESKPDPSLSGKDVEAPNVFQRVKQELEAVLYCEEQGHPHHHHKETHGLRDDIDVNTSPGDIKAPNVFERAKEEIEAIVDAIHRRKESKDPDLQSCSETRDSATKDPLKTEKPELHSVKNVTSVDLKATEEDGSLRQKSHHHKETHGRSSDFDENTSISEFKGPNVFERAKEEIEALIHTIHSKKDSEKNVTSFDLKAEEESDLLGHKPHHHKETHGMSCDFDENTPISEFKDPNVFERAKEEIEALIHTIHPKKDSGNVVSSHKKKSGSPVSIDK